MVTSGDDPVYPTYNGDLHTSLIHGSTLREHFAGLALQGLLAGLHCTSVRRVDDREDRTHDVALYATMAVKYADALIQALNAPPKE